jgi:hypothetical protein
MNKRSGIVWGMLLLVVTGMSACHPSTAGTRKENRHMAEVKYGDGSRLYVDKASNQALIKTVGNDTAYTFCCYRVGMADSTRYDKKQEEAWNKYFDYDMQYEWIALHQGDSLAAVFFQPALSRDKNAREGILVFEVPKGVSPDSLVYKKSYGNHKANQLIVLNSPK